MQDEQKNYPAPNRETEEGFGDFASCGKRSRSEPAMVEPDSVQDGRDGTITVFFRCPFCGQDMQTEFRDIEDDEEPGDDDGTGQLGAETSFGGLSWGTNDSVGWGFKDSDDRMEC